MALSSNVSSGETQSQNIDPCLELELSPMGEPLIPRLPDDVALYCLLRLPIGSHIAVCRRWHQLLGNKKQYFSLRNELGFHDPQLFVSAFHRSTGKIEWKVLDLTHFSWHTIPEMPYKVRALGFRCLSLSHEGTLIVCGGVGFDVNAPLNSVLKYEAKSNRWTLMENMITARSFFASWVIDGTIYVAGGNNANRFELDLAEAINPGEKMWQPIASMGTYMASYDTAVLNGNLLVTEGWFWPFYDVPRGQVYDPITKHWESMSAGLREGWTGPSVVLYERLFVISEHGRTRLKVYNAKNDSWYVVEGPTLPEQICKPFAVNCCDCRIFVVGQGLHVAVGHILKLGVERNFEKNCGFSVQWQLVDAPGAFSELTPSSAQVLFA